MKIFSSGVHLNYGTRPAQTPKPPLSAPPASSAASEVPAGTVEFSSNLRRPVVSQDPIRGSQPTAAGGQGTAGSQKPVLISSPIAFPIFPLSAAPPSAAPPIVSAPITKEPVVSQPIVDDPIVAGPIIPSRPILVSEPIFSPLSIDLTA